LVKLKEKTEYLWYKYDFVPKRHLGQNFLIDPHIVERIIKALELSEKDTVLEIGAGTGALTEQLVQKGGRVIAVEIDEKLCTLLRKELKGYDNLEVICADITHISLKEKFFKSGLVKVVGNLPYQIASSLLLSLVPQDWIKFLVVMVQREVAQRIMAKPGDKRRGVLSVLLNYYSTISRITDVPPQAFVPPPRVGSSVIKMKKRESYRIKAENGFSSVVRAAFSLKRKMLVNSLSAGLGINRELIKEKLSKVGVDWRRRAEDLSVEEFVRINNSLRKVSEE